jgi:hypothetical protein
LKKVTRRNILAIAVTPFLQEGDVEKIIGSGFSMCLEKPVSLATFQAFCTSAARN